MALREAAQSRDAISNYLSSSSEREDAKNESDDNDDEADLGPIYAAWVRSSTRSED